MPKRSRVGRSPTTNDEQIGLRIRTQRSNRGFSQTKLGELIGVTFQQVQKYEKGLNRVPASRLVQIAAALGVDVNVLLVESTMPAADNNHDHAPTELLLKRHGVMPLVLAFLRMPPAMQTVWVRFTKQAADASNHVAPA